MRQFGAMKWPPVFLAVMLATTVVAEETTKAKSVPVQVVAVETAKMVESVSFIGSLVPWRKVNITSSSLSNIKKIYVTDGQRVKQGDPLFLLDDRVARSDLESAKAQFQNAQQDFQRAKELARTNAVSKSQVENASSDFVIAQANLESARTKLDLLTLRAPFSGGIGIIKVSVGALAIMGQDLVSLEDNSVLYVDFRTPQRMLPRLRIGQPFVFRSAALGELRVPGKIEFIDPSVEDNASSILVRGLAANPDGTLLGDIGGRVDLEMATYEDALVIPRVALIPTLQGNDVFHVVDSRARRVAVKVIMVNEGRAAIQPVLDEGDSVVTVGQYDLEDGALVQVVSVPN
jgi:membrane fusion protein (multidrug efflux system)